MATDTDGNSIEYTIESGDDTQPKFMIHPSSGLIETTATTLDRETRGSYVLTVVATDDGNPKRSVCYCVYLCKYCT